MAFVWKHVWESAQSFKNYTKAGPMLEKFKF
jgi:hypothetical protein